MNYQARVPRSITSGWFSFVTAALAVAIFITDLFVQLEIRHLGIVIDTFYVVVVLMSARLLRPRGAILVSAGCIGLTVLSFILMPFLLTYFELPPATETGEGIANTTISVALIALTTLLVLREQAAADALRKTQVEQAAADALHKAQAELGRINRVLILGEMATSVAHEIKQPVAAVVTHTEAGLRWLDGQQPDLEEVRQSLSQILRASNRIVDIIDRVRSLVNQAPPRKDWLDINEAIGEVIALTKAELERNGVQLQTHLSGDLPPIRGDRVQLQQVIVNLVLNASEAMSGVSDRPRELSIVSRINDAKGLSIQVRDTGSGLDMANFDRLFRSFYTTKPEGMGMGLAISRTIVEAHGGRLLAAPGAPFGAVFSFTLPIDANSPGDLPLSVQHTG